MTVQGQVTRTLQGLRGDRYGEMLLVKSGEEGLFAEVYNTYTLNDCPEELWVKLDPEAIARSEGALAAVPNGPRYWLVDSIEKTRPEVPEVRDFGGILMTRAAVLNLGGTTIDPSPYRGRRVARTALFAFDADCTVYELVDPDGAVYVMQSWCTAVDPGLVESDLMDLGKRLELPDGWAYQSRRLSEPLRINTTDKEAVVLQDELRNSYSLVG